MFTRWTESTGGDYSTPPARRVCAMTRLPGRRGELSLAPGNGAYIICAESQQQGPESEGRSPARPHQRRQGRDWELAIYGHYRNLLIRPADDGRGFVHHETQHPQHPDWLWRLARHTRRAPRRPHG